jgi:hypothetical protein
MPDKIYYGDIFTARIDISNVNNLQAFQIQLNFDKRIIHIVGDEGGTNGVSGGLVGSAPILVDMWSYFPEGSNGNLVRITGRVENEDSANGSGFLAEIHFRAVGAVGQTGDLNFTEESKYKNGLFDNEGEKIDTNTPWNGSAIEIIEPAELQITSAGLPTGVAGGFYNTQLSATGGYTPYTWYMSGLPSGIISTESGDVSGTTAQTGSYPVTVIVSDRYTPPNTLSREMRLNIYALGDANEDGVINKADVIKLVRIYLGIDSSTPAADANGDGKINMADAVHIQRIYLGN